MGHSDGDHERDDLSADDSPWSDGVWSEDDEGSLSFEDSGEGSDADSDGDEVEAVEESDSSEDEVAPRNTVGDIPYNEWYKDEEHIGYDQEGKKIKKRDREGRIAAFLKNVDDAKNWRKIYDAYNDEEVQITKDEAKLISRLLKGKTPHSNVDPYPDYVDWFEYEDKGHPLSSAPEPKRRFVPSKWEQKKCSVRSKLICSGGKVVKLVRAIRNGWIKFDKPKEEPKYYLLWGDETDTADNKRQGLSYIPAPKPNLPGHEESYNPSVEYIPTQEEIDSYQLIFESLRSVPAYEKALREGFDRCLDLYLCPRSRKKRINIDPESLKPKLPSKKDLRPYPKTCYLEFKGHSGPVKSLSVEITGQWLASGSADGTIRIWEVETGRCLKVWKVGGDVRHIAWNPSPDRPILAAIVDHDLLLLNAEVGSEEAQMRAKELLCTDESAPQDDTVAAAFHPSEKMFFVATKKFVQVYDLQKAQLVKKLESGLREISSISVHPGGDNVIVEAKMNPLIVPLEILRGHSSLDGRGVLDCKFHPKQPWLFTAGADSMIRLYCD
ncbi:hypothetical protein PR202_gb20840 [Eleusine coracana subsp. coracana]|uniref:BOP1 N-terminal domain-containing protein n=1 Tax=Eleusine coracana subsp. coracana TaxID=191504 RepID=A0AAV5FDJ8_ELECO|nr:hypothetical protein PR202_gb20840 [Eleusine coracana subsp. coracana]